MNRSLGRIALDCLFVAVTFVAVTIAFGPVFGGTGYLIAGIGGTLLGIAVGVVTSLPRLRGWLPSAAGVIIAFIVFGTALAVPSKTIGGVIPTLDGLRELLLGAVFSWKGLLTAEPPADGFPSLLVVPYVVTLVGASIATILAMQLRKHAAWAVLPGFAALVVAIAFGTRIAALPTVLGLLVAGSAITWVAWRRSEWRRSLASDVEVTNDGTLRQRAQRRRLGTAAAMIAGALVVGGATSLPIQPDSRQVLREAIEPPIDIQDYPSPLAGFRDYHKSLEEETLFTVSGMPEDGRIRLATLDAYDGTVWAVAGADDASGSGTFTRVGDHISSLQSGQPATVTFEMDQYSGIWIPDVGYAQSIAFAGDDGASLQGALHYNGSTGTAITTDGLGEGDSYTIDAIVPEPVSIDDLEGAAFSEIEMPDSQDVPELLPSWTTTNGTTEATRLASIVHMQQVLQAGGYSSGLDGQVPSLAGHGSARIQAMLDSEVLVGDDEQYATVLALALERLGVPARVVMGFYPTDGFDGGGEAVEIVGGDVHAWVEIAFEGHGWVPFDATPPEDNTQIQPDPQPQPQPRAQVLQPPQPPDDPVDLTPETQPDDGQGDDDDLDDLAWLAWLWTGVALLALVILVAMPFVIVAVLKRRRRARRFSAATEGERLSGGWHEVVDAAVDLGLAVPAGVTRREVAGVVLERYPQSRADDIGEYVDEGVFGPADPGAGEVDAFWRDVDTSVDAMHSEATRRQRIVSRLSLRSFLRRRRERRGRR